jgi:hypothetical protein
MRRPRARWSFVGSVAIAIAIAGVCTLVATTERDARAEPTPSELVTARELFERGMELERDREWTEALAVFRRIAAIVSTPKVHFHLGLCLEETGHWVEALNEFQAAELPYAGTRDPALLAEASAHADSLKRRIPRVVIVVEGASEPVVRVDEAPLSATLLGVEVPMDPGRHRLVVDAPGRRRLDKPIDLVAGSPVLRVDVRLVEESPGPSRASPSSATVRPTSGGGPGAPAFLVGGIGVALLGGAAVFYGLRAQTIADLDQACSPDHVCPESVRDDASRGRAYTTTGNVLLGIGLVTVVTAVVIGVVRSSRDHGRE